MGSTVTPKPPPIVTPIPVKEKARKLEKQARDWRIEVIHGGKYWRWRERKRKGRIEYGGKYDTLTTERKIEYVQNVAKRNERKARQENDRRAIEIGS